MSIVFATKWYRGGICEMILSSLSSEEMNIKEVDIKIIIQLVVTQR